MKNEKFLRLLLTASIVVFWLLLFFNPDGSQKYIFFSGTHDLFADFFNCQRYIAGWDPYFNEINGYGEKCYFPLAYLILGLFNGFADYANLSLQECYSCTEAIMSCILFSLISCLIYFHSLKCLIPKFSFYDSLLIVFSSLFLFTIERGNLTLLACAGLCYYLAFKDNENKNLKYFSLFALCFATVLKVYPVLFGILLLKEKRISDIAACVTITLVLVFVPFLFFERGVVENFTQLISNVKVNTSSYSPYHIFPRFGLASTLYPFLKILHIGDGLMRGALQGMLLITYALSFLSILIVLISKNKWNSLFLLTVTLIMLPVNSALYCGMYIVPVFLFYLYRNDMEKNKWFLLLFFVFLCPIQIVVKTLSVNYLISNIIVDFAWIVILIRESPILIKSTRKILAQ